MAKEANSSTDNYAGVERRKKKSKNRKKVGNGGGSSRPSYCPNKSKSFNASRSVHRNYHVSTSALKKNNDELAKSLNKCKGIIAQLHTEKLDMERQLMEVRAERPLMDEHAIEAEVSKRVAAVLFPVKTNLNNAIDNMVVLSGNLTQSLQSVTAPLRMSTQSQSSQGARGSSIGHNRGSSIGVGANFRMRPIINFPARDGTSGSGNSSTSNNSPPKQLSKVSPMVAGHAITRPRIQLTRMDVEAMSAAREREMLDQQDRVVEDETSEVTADEHIASVHNAEDEVFEDIEATPPHPGRSRFNLTNIGEENSFLEESRAEESIVEENEEDIEELSRMDVLEETREEAVSSPDLSLVRRARPSVRQSTGMTRQSSSRSSGIVPTVSDTSGSTEVSPRPTIPTLRLSFDTTTAKEVVRTTSASPRASSSRPPLMQLSSVSSSPQVDILKTQRHPAVVIPDLVQMNHPALPTTRYSQPCSTPFLPTPSPGNKRTSAPIFSVEDFPENPSESFLEQMIDSDPMEGPSWLFNPTTKKRRSSVARKLSSVLSESERGSSARMTSSLDSSDIDMSGTGEGETSSREVSGYVLDRDLLETAVVINSPDVTIDTPGPANISGPVMGMVSSETTISSVTTTSTVVGEEDMDLTRPAGVTATNNSTEKSLNSSNQENAPEVLVDPANINEGSLSISVTNNPRTPLSSLTYTDPSGQVVKFNPRTDTGVSVAGLREARILLNNVGMEGANPGVSTTPYKLSECYIDVSPGRSMSLDQLFSLGLRAGIASPAGSPATKKRKYVSEAGTGTYRTPPKKKNRATDLPNLRQKGVRASLDMIPPSNMVVGRLEVPAGNSSTDAELANGSDCKGKEEVCADEVGDLVERFDSSGKGSKLLEVNKKKSIMPSFVRLEKSPVKKISVAGKKIHYTNIDDIPCVGNKSNNGKGEISNHCLGNEDNDGKGENSTPCLGNENYGGEGVNSNACVENDSAGGEGGTVNSCVENKSRDGKLENSDKLERPANIETVPPRTSRRNTRVIDYAALLNDSVENPPIKKRSKTAGRDLEVRHMSKDVDSKDLSEEASSQEPAERYGEQVGEISSKEICERGSSRRGSEKKNLNVGAESGPDEFINEPGVINEDTENPNNSKNPQEAVEISLVPPSSLELASTSRGSSFGKQAQTSATSSSHSAVESEIPEGRGGRSRRGQAVSYKEPPLGKKLRQGDAGSTSVYKDFKPVPKSKKKKK